MTWTSLVEREAESGRRATEHGDDTVFPESSTSGDGDDTANTWIIFYIKFNEKCLLPLNFIMAVALKLWKIKFMIQHI